MNAATALTDPFSQLLILEERVRLCGASLPKREDARAHWHGVKAAAAGQRLILPLDDVAQILEPRQFTRVPGCAHWVLGVLNLRGRLLPVFGLSAYFGGAGGADGKARVVVVDKAGLFCGIAMDRIIGMQKFYQEEFSSLGEEVRQSFGAMTDYVGAVTESEGDNWYQLDICKMAGAILNTPPDEERQ